jgi:hypothetical protein
LIVLLPIQLQADHGQPEVSLFGVKLPENALLVDWQVPRLLER